jgi:hypothetical protein
MTTSPVDLALYRLSSPENLGCSLAASCVAEAVTYPFEVAKVRLQIQGSRELLAGERKLS